jgi:NADH-quinone oxidoreductase subunit A
MPPSSYPTLWPFLVYGILVVLLTGGMLLASYFLGERHQEKETDEVYEAGITATGTARFLFPVHFYLIAMFFVIFDLEAVFIISWAIAIRPLGWTGYVAIVIFIVVLVAVLIYEWRIGALNFGPEGKKILREYKRKIKKS